jgi:hypothetical protein
LQHESHARNPAALRPAASDYFASANHNACLLAFSYWGRLSKANSTIAILDKPPKRILQDKRVPSANGKTAAARHGTLSFVKEWGLEQRRRFAGVPGQRPIDPRVTES